MKISTRLALTKAICVGVIVIVGSIVASTDRTVRQQLIRNANASEIMNGVFSVRYLMHEYIIGGHEERARIQLDARQASLSNLFAQQSQVEEEEEEILARLRRADATVRGIFDQIVTNYNSADSEERKSSLFRELEDRLSGQIMIRIETMIAAASALAEHSRLGVLRAQNRESAAVAAFGLIVVLTFGITMLIGVRRVFRPLERLQAGVAVIGAGNFDVQMDDSGDDEISDLARAFNDMTKKLRNRELKIRRLVDSNIIGIVISDTSGAVLEANDAFLRLVGRYREQLKSGPASDVDDASGFQMLNDRALRELEESGAYAPVETEFILRSGRRIPVLIGGARIDDEPTSIVSFVLDLTERKLAQEALARTQADLTHMTRVSSLGALTASITHEVSQPLSGIMTNSSTCLRMLASEPANVEGARETVRRTIRDANRASDVITKLRALFAKKDALVEPVDLSGAASEVMALLRMEFRKVGLTLQTDLANDLPPILADRVQLQQVILNLLMNATDAMKDVEDRPKQIVVSTSGTAGGEVIFSVRDSGVGIREIAPERVFEPFYSTKDGGMGIGLAVCLSIIQSHNGRLWATQNEGPGATFSFCIPVRMDLDLENKVTTGLPLRRSSG